jgi:hypothetical protein
LECHSTGKDILKGSICVLKITLLAHADAKIFETQHALGMQSNVENDVCHPSIAAGNAGSMYDFQSPFGTNSLDHQFAYQVSEGHHKMIQSY